MKLGFIGTGKIASSVITGICGSSIKYSKISISSRNSKIAKGLKKKFKKISIEKASKGSSFPQTLLSNATASRDLIAGSVLSRQDLHVRQDVLISLKPIFRGQLINTSNTEVTPFYGNLPEDALKTNQEGRWMEAIRTIRGGQPIRASDLKPALMVKEGDTVLLSVVSGALTITSSMVALEDGKLDQQIDLINLESNEKVRARVSGQGRAESL